ncbi:MAG: sugar ABC transporter ATP-binding protein [Synergistota bacterium]|nr:sugar ABC transporter ATP-binding protein [Synergistota bacterium]
MRSVSKAFPGVQALRDVTLQVRPGTVHALMGENGAGKSTLMKCLFGLYTLDEGQVLLDGEPVTVGSSREALDLGISMIHQELHPIPARSVMENIWLGRAPLRKVGGIRFIDRGTMERKTRELMEELELDIDPRSLVRTLSVSRIQSMEIAKAVSYNARIIVMDEPTSSLTGHEVSRLFDIIRGLRSRGISIIYISHKMEEILEIADDVTIMRDGRKVGTWPAGELTTDLIISRMVGREITNRFPPRKNEPAGEAVLEVSGLTSTHAKSFRDVSFTLRRGEILGVGGLVGAQRTEAMEALFGLRSLASGRVMIDGGEADLSTPIKAKRRGLALLTEERRATGIFPVLTVEFNLLAANLGSYVGRMRLLEHRRMRRDARDSIDKLSVKTPSPRSLIRDLSGGNQQKVLFARWLLIDPDILILDEPTRGIDVGAKYEIYSIMSDLAAQGKSIIMISSEMPELLGMTDRILVMSEGRLAGVVKTSDTSEEEIMRLATKFVA